jgi:hypothetical protein
MGAAAYCATNHGAYTTAHRTDHTANQASYTGKTFTAIKQYTNMSCIFSSYASMEKWDLALCLISLCTLCRLPRVHLPLARQVGPCLDM